MSVFHGNWDEDAEAFLKSYLQCRGSEDDKQLAKSFVYYLQAYSAANEWFEDLPEEEKRSWVKIERLFRQRWLNEEEISVNLKESVTVTSKNEKQPASTIIFSSTTPSVTSSNSAAASITTTAFETQSTIAVFAQKHQKIEDPPIFTITTSKTPSLSISRPINDEPRVHASPLTHDDVYLHPPSAPTFGTTASSPFTPPVSRHENGALLCAVFESQPPTGSLPSTTIVKGSKTHSASTGSAENYQKVENLLISPNTSPHFPPNEPISPQPPPNTPTTPLSASTRPSAPSPAPKPPEIHSIRLISSSSSPLAPASTTPSSHVFSVISSRIVSISFASYFLHEPHHFKPLCERFRSTVLKIQIRNSWSS